MMKNSSASLSIVLRDFSLSDALETNPSDAKLETFFPSGEEDMVSLVLPKQDASLAYQDSSMSKTYDEASMQEKLQEKIFSLKAEFAEERKQLELIHKEALAACRLTVIDEVARNLRSQIVEGLEEIETHIGQEVARFLAAFMEERVSQIALQNFAEKLSRYVVQSSVPLILEGDPSLWERLQQVEGFDASTFIFHPTEGGEIRLRHNQHVIATRLSSFFQELRSLVE